MESVHKVGFDIDKEKLAKALRYDRDQYEKGFNDGRLSAESQWIPCEGRCPEKSGDYLVTDDCKNIYVNEWHCLLHKWQYDDSRIMAWMPLPSPFREGGES